MAILSVKKTELYKKLEQRYSGDIKYATSGSAGIDLRACIESKVKIAMWSMQIIPCGIKLAIPEGYAGFIIPRSGLARDFAVDLANNVGLLDSDYRGEVLVMLRVGSNGNADYHPVVINPMDRIAQLVIMPYQRCSIVETDNLEETERGSGGFGSTGSK